MALHPDRELGGYSRDRLAPRLLLTLGLSLCGVAPSRGETVAPDDALRCLAAEAAVLPAGLVPVCTAAIDAAGDTATRYRLHLARAGLRVATGDAAGARADVEAARDLVPEAPAAWLRLAELTARAEPLAAAEAFEAAAARAGTPEARGAIEAALDGHLARASGAATAAGDHALALALADRLVERAADPARRHERLVYRAGVRLAADDARGAEGDWAEAIAADPGQPWAFAARGLARAEAGERTGAIEDLAAARDRAPAVARFVMPAARYAGLLRDEGVARLAAEDPFGAVEMFREAVALDGLAGLEPAIDFFQARAAAHLAEGRDAAAEGTIRLAASFFRQVGGAPMAASFEINLAELYDGSGERERAREIARALPTTLETAAADAAPRVAASLWARAGAVLARLGEDEAAADAFARGLAVATAGRRGNTADWQAAMRVGDAVVALDAAAPALSEIAARAYAATVAAAPPAMRVPALVALAEVKARLGRGDAAAEALDLALTLAPDRAEARLARARLHAAAGEREAALAELDAAAEATGTTPALRAEGLSARGRLLLEAGRLDAARLDLDAALALAPDDAAAWHARARLNAVAGRREDARLDYDRTLALAPDLLDARLERARLLHDLGRHEAALADFDLALAVLERGETPAPATLEAARFYRGLSRFYAGDPEGAHDDLDAVAARRPDDPLVGLWRGRAALRLGRVEAALADFDASFPALSAAVVASYQRRLAERGFGVGAIDGVYGPATRRAFAACARARCL